MSTTQSNSPSKRRRVRDDEILPSQSASVTSPTELTSRTRLQASGSSRPSSPARDLHNELRVAEPSVDCTPPKGITWPEKATLLRKQLVLGFGQSVIPMGLKDKLLESDPEGTEAIPDYAFDSSDHYTSEELDSLWQDIQWISKEADWNTMFGADENSWCDIVRRIVHCGLRVAGSDMLDLKSV
ncbi:hypothetical protein LTS18_005167 [Coniosporium uncinatum]|uniref:Uncharacterized protein n=1 Tax=Coniosporium uncinatum TaxID=93489 RepID=A0ACC3DBF7_9PEZI|nr:hypothetical protein LTS18_005167 [Coniosporium uncinatum]